MKKIVAFLSLIVSSLGYSQIEDTTMDEMVISILSKKTVQEILYNVKKQTFDNYTEDKQSYVIKNTVLMNDSINVVNANQKFDISLRLRDRKISKELVKKYNNVEVFNKDFLARYKDSNDSPIFWIYELLQRKYIVVPELDFLNNLQYYKYDRKVDGNITTVRFFGDELYEGYFRYDKKYNLIEMKYKLIHPYLDGHSQAKNGKKLFNKEWNFASETVYISFGKNRSGEIYIRQMDVFQEIKNYNFVKYNNKKEVILQDKDLHFKSKMQMRIEN